MQMLHDLELTSFHKLGAENSILLKGCQGNHLIEYMPTSMDTLAHNIQ